jgi:hypothetical protein
MVLTAALALGAPVGAWLLAPSPWAVIPMALILALIWTQLAFYRHLVQKRSGAFAFAVVPMQVLFFLGCVIAVPLGIIMHQFGHVPAPAKKYIDGPLP